MAEKPPDWGFTTATWRNVHAGCRLLTHRLDQASYITRHHGRSGLGYLVLALFTFKHAGCHSSRLCSHGTRKRIKLKQSVLQTCITQRSPATGDHICVRSALYICRFSVCRNPVLLARDGPFVLPGCDRSRLSNADG